MMIPGKTCPSDSNALNLASTNSPNHALQWLWANKVIVILAHIHSNSIHIWITIITIIISYCWWPKSCTTWDGAETLEIMGKTTYKLVSRISAINSIPPKKNLGGKAVWRFSSTKLPTGFIWGAELQKVMDELTALNEKLASLRFGGERFGEMIRKGGLFFMFLFSVS